MRGEAFLLFPSTITLKRPFVLQTLCSACIRFLRDAPSQPAVPGGVVWIRTFSKIFSHCVFSKTDHLYSVSLHPDLLPIQKAPLLIRRRYLLSSWLE